MKITPYARKMAWPSTWPIKSGMDKTKVLARPHDVVASDDVNGDPALGLGTRKSMNSWPYYDGEGNDPMESYFDE